MESINKNSSIYDEDALRKEEDQIADQLKAYCDHNGKETNPSHSASLLHKLGQIYRIRTHDKMSLIRSVTLYNSAIVRSPTNKQHIINELSELCSQILTTANAKQLNADLIATANSVKHKLQTMRSYADQHINDNTQNQTWKSSDDSIRLEKAKIANVRQLQDKITDDYTSIMADLTHYCETVMGDAPCKFALIGMGSLSRKEITPYSDFEHIIVLDENCFESKPKQDVLDYFRWLSVIFQVVVINLGETILPNMYLRCFNDKKRVWYYDTFIPYGVSFDSMMPHACKFPLGRTESTTNNPWKTELIKPVSEMLNYLTVSEDLKNGHHLRGILTKICLVHGDQTIFDDFQSKMYKMLEESSKESRIKDVEPNLLEDLENFSTRNTLPGTMSSNVFNLKKVVYRSTTLFISALGRIYNVRASSSFDIIERLVEMKEISEEAKHKLMYAVSLACELRLGWYVKCKEQQDFIKSKARDETVIQVLLELTAKHEMISYFQIAYALQCDTAKRLNLKKKFFYSNPQLVNSSIFYYLGETEKFIECTNMYKELNENLHQRLYTFDESMKCFQSNNALSKCGEILNEKSSSGMSAVSGTKETKLDEESAIAKYIYEFGSYLYNQDKLDEALEYFQNQNKVLEKIQERSGVNNPSTDEVLNSSRSQRANETTQESNTQTTNLERKIAISLNDIGDCLMRMSRFPEAMKYYQRSVKIKERISSDISSDPLISVSLHSTGYCLMRMNDLVEAMDYFRRSLQIDQRISSDVDSDPAIAVTLLGIGRCYKRMNEQNEALKYFKQSLRIREQISSEKEKDNLILMLLQEIGRCLLDMCNFREALDYLKRSLEMQKLRSLGYDTDSTVAVIVNDIGRCLMEMNELNEALDYFEKSLGIKENLSLETDTDPAISNILNDIGCCLMNMNKLQEALEYFERSLKIKEKISLGNDSDLPIAITLHDAGACLIGLDKVNEAMEYLQRSLDTKKRISLGVDTDPEVSVTLHEIGRCYMRMKKPDLAIDYYKQSIEIEKRRSVDIDNKRDIAITLSEIGGCLMEMERLDEAMVHLKQSLDIKKQISLEVSTDPSISISFNKIGRCLMRMNKQEEALDYLKQSLEIREKISLAVDTDPAIFVTVSDIAECLIQMNEASEAMKYFKRLVPIQEPNSGL